jgi:hypothetical protein
LPERIILPAGYKPTTEQLGIVYTREYIKNCILGTLCLFGLSSTFIYGGLQYFDDYDTQSEFYQNFYFRGNVNTSYFSPGMFLAYIGVHALGFVLVTTVTLKRTDPLVDRYGSHKSFY